MTFSQGKLCPKVAKELASCCTCDFWIQKTSTLIGISGRQRRCHHVSLRRVAVSRFVFYEEACAWLLTVLYVYVYIYLSALWFTLLFDVSGKWCVCESGFSERLRLFIYKRSQIRWDVTYFDDKFFWMEFEFMTSIVSVNWTSKKIMKIGNIHVST